MKHARCACVRDVVYPTTSGTFVPSLLWSLNRYLHQDSTWICLLGCFSHRFESMCIKYEICCVIVMSSWHTFNCALMMGLCPVPYTTAAAMPQATNPCRCLSPFQRSKCCPRTAICAPRVPTDALPTAHRLHSSQRCITYMPVAALDALAAATCCLCPDTAALPLFLLQGFRASASFAA